MSASSKSLNELSIRYPGPWRRSRIIFGSGTTRSIVSYWEAPPDRIFLIADDKVAPLYADQFTKRFEREGIETSLLPFTAGEQSKNFRVAAAMQTALLSKGAERGSCVVALGGGVCCDLAGYVAASVLRGLRLVLAPTSLLAMIDASIGGKVAVNHARGKNLIGFLYPAETVLIDTRFLKTLPIPEWKNGLAEMVKIAVVGDKELFDSIRSSAASLTKPTARGRDRLIFRAVELKKAVVEKDPFERGRRAALNFGHTVGHALEKSSRGRLTHGEAVSIGMVVESRIAAELGVMPKTDAKRIEGILSALGLPTHIPKTGAAGLMKFIDMDKKRRERKLVLSLPRRIGRMARAGPLWGIPLERDELLDLLRSAGCSA